MRIQFAQPWFFKSVPVRGSPRYKVPSQHSQALTLHGSLLVDTLKLQAHKFVGLLLVGTLKLQATLRRTLTSHHSYLPWRTLTSHHEVSATVSSLADTLKPPGGICADSSLADTLKPPRGIHKALCRLQLLRQRLCPAPGSDQTLRYHSKVIGLYSGSRSKYPKGSVRHGPHPVKYLL